MRSIPPHDSDDNLSPHADQLRELVHQMAESSSNSPMRWTVVNDRLSFDWPAVCRWFYSRNLYRYSDRVYLACLGRAARRADGMCAVSIAQLADECVLPSDQARRAFAELTAHGLLSVISGPDPSDRQSHGVQLCLEVRLPLHPADTTPSNPRADELVSGV
jgi:hypothetical protein